MPSPLAVAIVGGMALFVVGCADNPPAPIVNKSTPAAADRPEVRQTGASRPDYGEELPRGPDYVVQRGDTLYSVAFRLGMDYRTLAAINGIDAPYVIQVSQRLKTVPSEQASVPVPACAVFSGAAMIRSASRACSSMLSAVE